MIVSGFFLNWKGLFKKFFFVSLSFYSIFLFLLIFVKVGWILLELFIFDVFMNSRFLLGVNIKFLG